MNSFEIVKSLVGDSITKDNLALVDSFVYEKLSIFMPVGGNCGYAISPSHTHPSYMFVLSYDNQTEFYVEDKKYESSPNTIFCLSPNVEHHEVQNYLPPKYSAIFIDKVFFEDALALYSTDAIDLDAMVVDIKDSKLDRLLKGFIFESSNEHVSKNVVLQNISSLITHELIRIVLNKTISSKDVSDNQAISEVIKYISTNFEVNMSVVELATIANLSKSHFTKVFTQSISMSPMEYLKEVRLQNAKKMLLSQKLNMTEVSSLCGFNSPAYFSKIFKDAFNESPKEFAKRNIR